LWSSARAPATGPRPRGACMGAVPSGRR
jgi:hypothetical protein